MAEYLKKADVLDYLVKCAEGAQADFDENGGESGIYAECLEDVIQDITSMATVEPENWISVKDELPDAERGRKKTLGQSSQSKRTGVLLRHHPDYFRPLGVRRKETGGVREDVLGGIHRIR